MNTENRRHFVRSTFHAPVELAARGSRITGQLLDMSLKGALVEVGADWPGQIGDACRLRLNLAPGVVILMEAMVVHLRQGQAGLRAEHIDVDSMTHLRHLVELNAENPDLLERELGQLLH